MVQRSGNGGFYVAMRSAFDCAFVTVCLCLYVRLCLDACHLVAEEGAHRARPSSHRHPSCISSLAFFTPRRTVALAACAAPSVARLAAPLHRCTHVRAWCRVVCYGGHPRASYTPLHYPEQVVAEGRPSGFELRPCKCDK